MTDEGKMYAVKNDEGEWMSLDGTQTGIWYSNNPTLFKDKSYAEAQSMGRRAHVVELTEAPAKVVVSKLMDRLIKEAHQKRQPIEFLFACSIPDGDQEDLLYAYATGNYKVEKPKRWNVKVPKKWSGDDKHYWTKEKDGALTWAYLINNDYMIPAQQFTAAEIEHYGLGECERVEVDEHD
ncbi:DUF1642 domain-containing protein [Lacticaseibacillus sp. 866-1]|uniref:DUF1642 domain-containing protein n=1 Tax=Lacticaseibacillus sp. 866-1 TaxID=2799576 RepID=UPI001940620A|nr:DUF1642 domain-containing protein [Lacticaseibacillus sp. 866-1]